MNSFSDSQRFFIDQLNKPANFAEQFQKELQEQKLYQSHGLCHTGGLLRQRVSEKLLGNRLKRMQHECQQQREKQELLLRRKLREKQITEIARLRQEAANKRKEDCIRQTCTQQHKRRRDEQSKSNQHLQRYKANLQKIERGRSKVQQCRYQYVTRIQKRTQERLLQAQRRRKLLHSIDQLQNDEIHMQEWTNYKTKLEQKHSGMPRQAPDYLYQQFNQKNNWARNILSSLQNKKELFENSNLKRGYSQNQSKGSVKNNEKVSNQPKTLLNCRKVEYFGIHQSDMMKKTVKDMQKMRSFIQERSCFADPLQDSQLLANFESFLKSEILEL